MPFSDEERRVKYAIAKMKERNEKKRLEKLEAAAAMAENKGQEMAQIDMVAITRAELERLKKLDISLPEEKKKAEAAQRRRKQEEELLKKQLLDATRSNAEQKSAIVSLRTTAYLSIVGVITLSLIQGLLAAAAVAIVNTNMKLNRVTDEKKQVQKINCTPKLRM